MEQDITGFIACRLCQGFGKKRQPVNVFNRSKFATHCCTGFYL